MCASKPQTVNQRWNQQRGDARKLQTNHNCLRDAPSMITLGWRVSAAAAAAAVSRVWEMRLRHSNTWAKEEKKNKVKEFQGLSATLRQQNWYPSKPGYLIQEKLVEVQGQRQSLGVASIIAGCLVNIKHLASSSTQSQLSSALPPPSPLPENLKFLEKPAIIGEKKIVKLLILSKLQSKGAA